MVAKISTHWRLRTGGCFAIVATIALLLMCPPGNAASPEDGSSTDTPPAQNSSTQNGSTNQSSTPTPADEKHRWKKNDRMFYIMPNYFTTQTESQTPLSVKEKFAITAKGAFDPYEFAIAGILAGARQAENAYPGFGQGMEGYGKRYGAAFADQLDSNIMVGGVYPAIFKTDPRYFPMGKGRTMVRIVYAFTRILITRTDSGHRLFNFPEFLGNATASAISNVYYPASDRGFSATANTWGVQMGIDALGDELKEFWPDIHRHLARKKKDSPQDQQ